MASTSISSFDPALKQIYRQNNVQKTTYKRRPLFGMISKFEGFKGRNMPIVNLYGNPQGRSAVFATAQANATPVKIEDFLLTRVNNYSVATIDGEVIEATRGDTAAFLNALKTKIDTAMNALADDTETSLFRSASGSRARLHGTTATARSNADPMVLTLLNLGDITNFEVGMTIVADNTEAGSSLHTTPASAKINKINRSAGTITTDYDNSSTTTDWAADDYLFVSGDQTAKMSGLTSWFPASAPGSSAFFGVDRTTDSRLSGTIHNGASQPLEESAIDAQSKVAREGGMPGVYLIHNAQYRRLVKELGAKKEYTTVNAQGKSGTVANVSYKGVYIDGDEGPIEVVACNKAPVRTGFMLTMESIEFSTLGNATKFLMEDGLRILRQAAADGYEVRLGQRGNLSSTAPIWSANVALPAP